jgi:hypothetical protein
VRSFDKAAAINGAGLGDDEPPGRDRGMHRTAGEPDQRGSGCRQVASRGRISSVRPDPLGGSIWVA